jgi:hypothetical protein
MLLALVHMLDAALSEVAQVQVLPKQFKIAPNMKSEWRGPNGTLGHMGAERKRKAFSQNTDRMEGGGEKWEESERRPEKVVETRCSELNGVELFQVRKQFYLCVKSF